MSDYEIYLKKDRKCTEQSVYVSTITETHELAEIVDSYSVRDAFDLRRKRGGKVGVNDVVNDVVYDVQNRKWFLIYRNDKRAIKFLELWHDQRESDILRISDLLRNGKCNNPSCNGGWTSTHKRNMRPCPMKYNRISNYSICNKMEKMPELLRLHNITEADLFQYMF